MNLGYVVGMKVKLQGTATEVRREIGQFYGYEGVIHKALRVGDSSKWDTFTVHVDVKGDASEILIVAHKPAKKLEDCIGDAVFIDDGQYCGNNGILKASTSTATTKRPTSLSPSPSR